MSFLLRLEHVFEKDSSSLANNVTVDLQNLFAPFKIVTWKETTLAANKDANIKRLNFEAGDKLEFVLNEHIFKNMALRNPQEEEMNEYINLLRVWRDSQTETNDIYEDYPVNLSKQAVANDFEITLSPMQIRTFIIEIMNA